MTANAPPPLLEVRGLCKSFPGVRALHHVDLTLGRGELLAVVGENGAGKSTLMKILAGIQSPDAGEIRIDGAAVRLAGVRDALGRGIALIHQELNLADNLDVASNIFLGREPRRWGFVDRRALHAQARDVIGRLGESIAAETAVAKLAIGLRQMVEIAKALSVDARILIMDEPTSSLSQRETDHLFRAIRELKAAGVSIIYISHRPAEVKLLADRVIVLRDGENAGELRRDEIDHDRIIRMMVGRDLPKRRGSGSVPAGDVLLDVRGLVTDAYPAAANDLSVRAGEIVGLAGLVGAGRTEFLETVFGVRRRLGGEVRVSGTALELASPAAAIRAGMSLVPEDRKRCGLVLPMCVRENVNLVTLKDTARAGFYDRAGERRLGRETVDRLKIRARNPEHVVQLLSGGNQQKVVFGKWLAARPRVLLLDEPTRGIDVGAKGEIHEIMRGLARDGAAVLFVSSELEEILDVADRVLVMHEGRIAGELGRDALSEEAIMRLATGGTRN